MRKLWHSSKAVEYNINSIPTRVTSIDTYGDRNISELSVDGGMWDKVLLPDLPGNKVYFYDHPVMNETTGYISFTVPQQGLTICFISKQIHKLRKKIGRDLMGVAAFVKVKKGHYIVEYET